MGAETYTIYQVTKTLVLIQTGATIGSDHQLTYVKFPVFDIFYQGQETLVGCDFSSGKADLVRQVFRFAGLVDVVPDLFQCAKIMRSTGHVMPLRITVHAIVVAPAPQHPCHAE